MPEVIMSSSSNLRAVILIVALSFGMAGFSYSQTAESDNSSSVPGLFIYGLHSDRWNPGFLRLRNFPSMSIILPAVNVSFGNNAYSPDYIGKTFEEGKLITVDDKNDLLSKLKQDELNLFSRCVVPVIGFTVGGFGINLMDYNLRASGSIPRDIFELVFDGWEEDRIYKFDDVEGEAYTYLNTSLSLARSIFPPRFFDEFSIGGTVKYIRGINYWALGRTDGYFQVTGDTINTEGLFEYHTSQSGNGFGLDLGFAGWLTPVGAMVGLYACNVVGGISWADVECEELQFERHKGVEVDSMSKREYWRRFFNDSDTSYSIGSKTTGLPRYILLTVHKPSLYMGGRGDLLFNYYQGLNEAPGQSMMPKVSIGTEYRQFDWLAGRLEFGIGGIEGFEIGGGIGLDYSIYRFNLNASWQRGVLFGAKGFSIGITNSILWPQGVIKRKPKPIKVRPPKKEKIKEKVKAEEVKPVSAELKAPTPPSGMEALTLADLGLKDMDPGQDLCRQELYPFNTDPVFYAKVDNEKYDKFFKDAAAITGTVLLAQKILTAIEERNKDVLSLYKLKKKEPWVEAESPLYTFIVTTLPKSMQRSRELVAIGGQLSGSVRRDFKGLNARKIPKVIKGINSSVENLKKAQKELPELMNKLWVK